MASKPLIKECLYILNVCGLGPSKNTILDYAKQFFSLIFVASLWFDTFLEFILNWQGISSVETLAATAGVYQVLIKLIATMLNKKQLGRILDKMEKFWSANRYGRNEPIENILSVSKRCAILMIVVMITAILGFAIPSLMNDSRQLLFGTYHPTDLNDSPDFELMWVAQGSLAALGYIILVGVDGLFVSLIITIIIEFKLIKSGIKQIRIKDKIDAETKESLLELHELIEHHILVLECIKDVNRAYSAILLNIFALNTVCMGFGLVGIVSTGVPPALESCYKYGCFVIFYVTQLFFYTSIGSFLTNESLSVSEAVYETDWYVKAQPQFRKACIMVIQRANRIEELTAVGLVALNLDTFTRVLKGAMSFYTVMQAMYDDTD